MKKLDTQDQIALEIARGKTCNLFQFNDSTNTRSTIRAENISSNDIYDLARNWMIARYEIVCNKHINVYLIDNDSAIKHLKTKCVLDAHTKKHLFLNLDNSGRLFYLFTKKFYLPVYLSLAYNERQLIGYKLAENQDCSTDMIYEG